MKREFFVETPAGTLHVYAKHGTVDDPANYPGVYVDLLRNGHERETLACVEYDSAVGYIFASLHDPEMLEPVAQHFYATDDDDDDDDDGDDDPKMDEMIRKYCCTGDDDSDDADYKASIFERTSRKWVVEMKDGKVTLGTMDNRMIFHDPKWAKICTMVVGFENEGEFYLVKEGKDFSEFFQKKS